MCGIFSLFSNATLSLAELTELFNFCMKIRHRGPDTTTTITPDLKSFIAFHRLCIKGLDNESGQPMFYDKYILVANAEIYNYLELAEKYNIELKTGSDCEIILKLFVKIGIKETLKNLDGVFAFIIYNTETKEFIVARDPIGIRSLYYSKQNNDGEYRAIFASEMKAIPPHYTDVHQFPPGKYFMSSDNTFETYYDYTYQYPGIEDMSEDDIIDKIYELLYNAVKKRLMSDRPVGFIISGGIDSTAIAAIARDILGPDVHMNSYTIGMEGAVDLYYARMAANHLNTTHHEKVETEEEFLDGIEETIKQIESKCTTTVRASRGNYGVAKHIKATTDDVVIYCGDVADEMFASYRGFQNAPNEQEFYDANLHMMKMVHRYDVLRSDKSISGAGLEARVPFADLELVNFVMSIPAKFKMFDNVRVEKYLLRKALERNNLLPSELLWRRKEAFSDGVSSIERGWFSVIQEHVDNVYTDEEYENDSGKFAHNPPYDKESYHYRMIFNKHYPGQSRAETIPYFWRHPFSTQLDPSARLLKDYDGAEQVPDQDLDQDNVVEASEA
jgi:asparagine synthase (glutamine-hydrolysing)